MNPSIKKMIFSESEMTDTGSGMKFASTIASADPLPIATWLGSIKKYIAAAATTAPKVMTA
jgi:hypothetical protein